MHHVAREAAFFFFFFLHEVAEIPGLTNNRRRILCKMFMAVQPGKTPTTKIYFSQAFVGRSFCEHSFVHIPYSFDRT